MMQRKLFVPGSQRRLGADVPVAEVWRFGCAYDNQIAIVRVMHLGRLWVDHNGDCYATACRAGSPATSEE